MKILLNIAVLLIVIVMGATAVSYFGLVDVSASGSHSPAASWILSTTAKRSVQRHARDVVVPALDDEALVLAGINDFDAMCASCHGAPGKAPAAVGQGLNPRAPDLAKDAAELSAAELFWVTKHGIRMTGMPAWGVTHDDDAIWPVVAFMTRLPELDAKTYQKMLAAAAGHGHHAGEVSNDAHEHVATDVAPASDIHIHDDGSEHEHGPAAEPTEAEAHEETPHLHDDDE